MAEAKITDARDTIKLMPGGAMKGYTRYEYMLGDLGPFVYEVAASEDTPEGFVKEVERRKKIIGAVQGVK